MPEDLKPPPPETTAWEIALGLLYEVDIGGTPIREAVEGSEPLLKADPVVAERATRLAVDTIGNLRKIDRTLRAFARNYTVPRIPAVERSLLRLAILQILEGEKTGSSETVRLAVRLAEQYGGKDSSRFVNGVLRAIADSATTGTIEAVIAPPPGPPSITSEVEPGAATVEKKEAPRFPGRRPGRREGSGAPKPSSADRPSRSGDRPASGRPAGGSRPGTGRPRPGSEPRARPASEPRARPDTTEAAGEGKARERRRPSSDRNAPGARPSGDRRPASGGRPPGRPTRPSGGGERTSSRPAGPSDAGGRPSNRPSGPGGRPPRRPSDRNSGSDSRPGRPPGRGAPRSKRPPPPAAGGQE